MKLLLVAETASTTKGGEAALPIHYFRTLAEMKLDVHLLCHARSQADLFQEFSHLFDRQIFFIADTRFQRVLWRLGKHFPYRIEDLVFGTLIGLLTQWQMAKWIRLNSLKERGRVVWQITPVGPAIPTLLTGLQMPLVIGPLCGGMDLPPAFYHLESRLTRMGIRLSKALGSLGHVLFRGKQEAKILFVANRRTLQCLPKPCQERARFVFDSGHCPREETGKTAPSFAPKAPQGSTRFFFSGRLVDWKGVRSLLKAFALIAPRINAVLVIAGDGPLREELQEQAKDLKLGHRVEFLGWISSEEVHKQLALADVFVMPSLRECGGNAVIEAMSAGIPVIASKWGGPSEMFSEDCLKWITVETEDKFIEGLALAMQQLSDDTELRMQYGIRGQKKVLEPLFSWKGKVQAILEALSTLPSVRGTPP